MSWKSLALMNRTISPTWVLHETQISRGPNNSLDSGPCAVQNGNWTSCFSNQKGHFSWRSDIWLQFIQRWENNTTNNTLTVTHVISGSSYQKQIPKHQHAKWQRGHIQWFSDMQNPGNKLLIIPLTYNLLHIVESFPYMTAFMSMWHTKDIRD